jgi:hypothetical protein
MNACRRSASKTFHNYLGQIYIESFHPPSNYFSYWMMLVVDACFFHFDPSALVTLHISRSFDGLPKQTLFVADTSRKTLTSIHLFCNVCDQLIRNNLNPGVLD